MKYINDTFREKRAENKMKQSNIVFNLIVYARDARKFVTLMLKIVKNPCAWLANFSMTDWRYTIMTCRNDKFRGKRAENKSNIVYNLVVKLSIWCLKCLNGQKHMWMAVIYQIKDDFWPNSEGDILYCVPLIEKHEGAPLLPPWIEAHGYTSDWRDN